MSNLMAKQKRQIEELLEERKTLRARVTELESQAKVDKKVADLRVQDLQEEAREQLQAMGNNHVLELNRVGRELSTRREALAQATAEVFQLTTKLGAERQASEALDASLTKAKAEIGRLTEMVKREKIVEAHHRLARKTVELDEMRRELVMAQGRVKELSGRLEHMEANRRLGTGT